MAIISLKITRVRKTRHGKIHTSEGKGKEKRDQPHVVGEEEKMNEDTKLISFAVTTDQYDMLKERAGELNIKTQDFIELLIKPFTIALEEMTNDEKRKELSFFDHIEHLKEKRRKALLGGERAVSDG